MGCSASSQPSSIPFDILSPYLTRIHPAEDSALESLSREERRARVTFSELTHGIHIKVPGFVILHI